MGGDGPTVSGLYRMPGVDWLLAKQEQFSSATTLRFMDPDGLPQDNTFGPNNKHHKLYRQFSKPPGQAPGKYSRDYPRSTSVEGNDRRYAVLKAPVVTACLLPMILWIKRLPNI